MMKVPVTPSPTDTIVIITVGHSAASGHQLSIWGTVHNKKITRKLHIFDRFKLVKPPEICNLLSIFYIGRVIKITYFSGFSFLHHYSVGAKEWFSETNGSMLFFLHGLKP